jgi:histidinol-phosphatase
MNEKTLIKLRKAAESIARNGGVSTLNYFKKSFELEFKSDKSPVTNADREAEMIIRDAIQSKFPEHGIIGEEYGSDGMNHDVVWVIDPIDGTQSFIHGIPIYTTLIGILIEGVPKVGIIYAPALDEMVSAASGSGAFFNGNSCKVRNCNEIGKATFLSTDVKNVGKYNFEKPFKELLAATGIHRTWGDAYGHMMVATGRADVMFDPILNVWDAAALMPVVTEAGGTFTDVKGIKTIESGNALSCSNGIHEAVIRAFKNGTDE